MAVGVFGICGMLDGEFGEWLVRGCVFLYYPNMGVASNALVFVIFIYKTHALGPACGLGAIASTVSISGWRYP